MKISSLILVILYALIVGTNNTVAQETSKPVAGNKRAESPAALPEYVIEVQRPDGCVVSPIPVKYKAGGVVYTLPRPARVAPDASGHPITSEVFVRAKQQGAHWAVEVWVGKGEFYDAVDIKIADLKLDVNQRVYVNEISQFGLSPIRVGVARILRKDAGNPGVRNFTESVSVESIEANELPDPYKLHLKNNSRSDVVAIQYNTFRRHEFVALKWLSPGHLAPLIKAGDNYKLSVLSEDKSCGDAEGYRPNQTDRVELVSAVFADGTFEGQHGLASLIKGTALGNRRNLERLIETLRFFSDAEPSEIMSQLNYLQEAMNEETDASMVERLRSMLPPLSDPDSTNVLNGFIRSGMHEVKVSLGRDLTSVKSLPSETHPLVMKKWIELFKTKYDRWLAAAENMTQ